MVERIKAIVRECSTKPAASKELIEDLQKALGLNLPADYASLLAFSNGIEGFIGENYVSIWSCERVRLYGVYQCVPFLLFIGSNGGDEGYAYDTRASPFPIVNVPFIDMEEKLIRVLGHSILEFLERLERAPLFPALDNERQA